MLKLQYLGHLMRRADSLEKTLMLGKIEGRRRREWQRIRQLNGITDSMNMSLRKLREIKEDRGAWSAVVQGVAKSWTWLRDWTTRSLMIHTKIDPIKVTQWLFYHYSSFEFSTFFFFFLHKTTLEEGRKCVCPIFHLRKFRDSTFKMWKATTKYIRQNLSWKCIFWRSRHSQMMLKVAIYITTCHVRPGKLSWFNLIFETFPASRPWHYWYFIGMIKKPKFPLVISI